MNYNLSVLATILFFAFLNLFPIYSSTALNCTDTNRVCTSFLAFKPPKNNNNNNHVTQQTLTLIESMFDVLLSDVFLDKEKDDLVFVRKNCSCASPSMKYLTNTTFTVRRSGGSAGDEAREAYGGLEYVAGGGGSGRRGARVGAVVSLHLMCGCSSGLWNYLMSYVMEEGDSVEGLASRFGVSMDSIEAANGIDGPGNVTAGEVYYIPLDSVPGEPYHLEEEIPPTPTPEPSVVEPLEDKSTVCSKTRDWRPNNGESSNRHIRIPTDARVIEERLCEGTQKTLPWFDFQFVEKQHLVLFGFFSHFRWNSCNLSFEVLKAYLMSSYFKAKLISFRGFFDALLKTVDVLSSVGTDVFEMDKPVTFTYEEILYSTDGFSDSNLLGHGTYGSVYYGILRDQEVAIKRMTATKTKEFTAEMKVLCKVHHTNLVELIGYAASDDELFLIYECAQKGSLRSHLHDPHNKGNTSLSWNVRVQIALDAARGLEYIHEHTKAHYVHRDIKTSNILLDSAFRAKISDFGLAKLVGKTGDVEASATKVVGTFGYLAPEYLSNGLATRKSDVYAFGVVLFELISGKEAITQTDGMALKNSERRSLASVMLAALRNSPNSMSMTSLKECIDPNLMDLYPHDCVHKMAMLAKQCVDEDPILRLDMKQVVITLSQILLSSVEWEATLAGNSQVFSGLVQGR
ncbi:hypothetical protein Scep_024624 [Stephania cephalantha]|uniref:LysM domain receptor-like kinase 3 n=1 Tax=Stephania cephalantha TaxID=152367 RepID=A0AAP0EXK8_9MAGN